MEEEETLVAQRTFILSARPSIALPAHPAREPLGEGGAGGMQASGPETLRCLVRGTRWTACPYEG